MPETQTQEATVVLVTPQVQAIATRLLEAAQLAMERAIAERDVPGRAPFPSETRSLESIFLNRLKGRSSQAHDRATAWLDRRRSAPRHPAVAPIDLTRTEPVLAQLARLAPASGLTLETLQAEGAPKPLSGSGPAALAASVFSTLRIRVHRMTCHELTDGVGNDEITLTGAAVSATGKTAKGTKVFDDVTFANDGQTRTLSPPRTLATFTFADDDALTVNGETLPVGWPRRYLATFLLAEIDYGAFPGFVLDIVDELKSASIAEVKAGVAAAVGSAATPLVGALAAALTWVAAKLTDWIIVNVTALIVSCWEDDPFLPVVSTLDLSGPGDLFGDQPTSGERHWNLKGHGGHYEFFFDWQLADPSPATPLHKEILTPGVVARRPLASDRAARLEVFMRGKDRGAFQAVELPTNWSGWGEVPNNDATFLSAAAPAAWAPGRLELFALGDDARLYQNSKNGEQWSGWGLHMSELAAGTGRFRFGPAAISHQENRVDVFATTIDRRIVHAVWNGQQWSGWLNDMAEGTFQSGPAVTARGAKGLDVFALGDDRHIYISSWQAGGGGWSNWAKIPAGTFTSAPTACDWNDERLDVFARGDDRQVYHSTWNGHSWSAWARDAGTGTFLSGPACVSKRPGVIDLFAVGDDSRMWQTHFEGSTWSGWTASMGSGTFA